MMMPVTMLTTCIKPISPSWRLAGLLSTCLLLVACQPAESPPEQATEEPSTPAQARPAADNPLKGNWLTPFQTPPFHRLQAEHFLPALEAAINDSRERIDAIVANNEPPDFANTIVAIEQAGAGVSQLASVFHGLVQVHGNSDWDEIAADFSTTLVAHADFVRGHPGLAARVRELHDRNDPALEPEQQRLLEETWQSLRKHGAALDPGQRQRLQDINRQLTELAELFSHNLRRETLRFELFIDDPSQLEGLPESLRLRAERDARDRGHTQGWVFTLSAHSLFPFLSHSHERELRKQIYQAWQRRAGGLRYGQGHDNGEVVGRMLALRAERARLLGYRHHLDKVLADSSIGSGDRIEQFTDQFLEAARPQARAEEKKIRALMTTDGLTDEPQPWDWWFYRERLRENELELSGEDVRAWFALEQVRDGAFALVNRLWGLSFHERTDLPRWHGQVSAYEVRDVDGSTLGVLYLDYIHRQGKAGGAWTSIYRQQSRSGDERINPVVANIANFPPSVAGQPVLLNPDEVETLFHELGHAVHALLSDVTHRSLAGAQVSPDFVEFPALLMERWAFQPEVLRLYAFHHETGAIINDRQIAALGERNRFLAGLDTLEQLAAIALDLAWHQLGPEDNGEPESMVRDISEHLGLPAFLSPRHRFNGFESLFSGRQDGLTYGRLWSDMLAADAFAAFVETGTINRELAGELRQEILGRGNSRSPMASWQAFRGRAPEIRALLEERGLVSEE